MDDQMGESSRENIAESHGDRDSFYFCGVLALRQGDLQRARRYFQKSYVCSEDYIDSRERLEEIKQLFKLYPLNKKLTTAEIGKFYICKIKTTVKYDINETVILLSFLISYDVAKSYVTKEFMKTDVLKKIYSSIEHEPIILTHFGLALLGLDKKKEAVEILRKAQSLDPENPTVLSTLGMALIELENWSEAESVFTKAADLNPDDPVILYNLGYVFFELSKFFEAAEILGKARKYDPKNPQILYALLNAIEEFYNETKASVEMGSQTGHDYPSDFEDTHKLFIKLYDNDELARADDKYFPEKSRSLFPSRRILLKTRSIPRRGLHHQKLHRSSMKDIVKRKISIKRNKMYARVGIRVCGGGKRQTGVVKIRRLSSATEKQIITEIVQGAPHHIICNKYNIDSIGLHRLYARALTSWLEEEIETKRVSNLNLGFSLPDEKYDNRRYKARKKIKKKKYIKKIR